MARYLLFICRRYSRTEGLTMKRRGLIAFAAAGLIIGGAWLITASAIRAQQPPAAPATPAAPPTQAVPPIGPYDPKLRTVSLPSGKKVHVLPATLETTQWGWFDNAQPPVLRVNSGDTVVMETMMHSHNQIIPGTTIEQIKKLRTDYPGRGPHTLTGPIYVEGAEPGDVLKVTINKIVPRSYGVNMNYPDIAGQFPKEFPGKETATDYVTVGSNADLNNAMAAASMAMINVIAEKRKLDRLDAYGLASVAMDCRIAPLTPKSLWRAPPRTQ